MSTKNPLPLSWYLFFGIGEPVSTVAGAAYALGNTATFYRELIPTPFKSLTAASLIPGVPEEARMAVAQLGSCYLLLAMVSFFFFTTLRRLPIAAAHKESLIGALLLALGIADWVHIGVTLYFLPSSSAGVGSDAVSKLASKLANPKNWNGLLFGNVIVTLALFSARTAWFLGLGRGSASSSTVKADGKTR